MAGLRRPALPGALALLLALFLLPALAAAASGGAAPGDDTDPEPAPSPKIPRGIDVSRFQGEIDWERVGETRVSFAFVQASRGAGRDCLVASEHCGPDPYYEANYEGARAAGLRVGAYHRAFASGGIGRRAKKDARREARVFARTVGKVRGRDLRPVLDVETPFKRLDERRLRLWIKTWLGAVKRRLGVKPMIYTNASSWAETGDTRKFARRGHRLWVANFDVPSPALPAAEWAGRGWAIWQYTSSGKVRGVSGHVDKNKLGVPWRKVLARSG